MSLEKTLSLKGMDDRYPIIQGGMGVGVSTKNLAGVVSESGGIGTISSAGLDRIRDLGVVESVASEVRSAKEVGGVVAINIMVAIVAQYELSVRGAIEGGVNMIVSGAGMPMKLPSIVKNIVGSHDHDINLVPIVSSERALKLICKAWERQGYRPDAVVLEGPKAGGHLGWSYKQLGDAGENFLRKYDLFDNLLDPVLDKTKKMNIPVIVAGGIYTHDDVVYALRRGADAVQLGTRFAVTEESGFIDSAKLKIINAKKEDIAVADEEWGSPCGLPFRYLKTSELYSKDKRNSSFCICSSLMAAIGLSRKMATAICPEGYVLYKGKCPAQGNADYSPLVTCGSDAYRLREILGGRGIMPAKEVMDELIG